MPQYGVSITKTVSFRGVQQHFSNVYHYQTNIPESNTAALNDLIDQLVALEKPFYYSEVSFVRARCWSSGGSAAANQMIVDRTLSGTGTNPNAGNLTDRERAFLVKLRAGNDSRGRPVFLKKWLHICAGGWSSQVLSNGNYQQTAQLSGPIQAGIVQFGNAIKTITPAGGTQCDLVAESGRGVTGSTTAHPWFEHHQLGDEWRNT